jgi:hypothetical protein
MEEQRGQDLILPSTPSKVVTFFPSAPEDKNGKPDKVMMITAGRRVMSTTNLRDDVGMGQTTLYDVRGAVEGISIRRCPMLNDSCLKILMVAQNPQ